MLKKIRITLALIMFVGITMLLLDFTGTLHHWLGWMAKVQLLPAVLACNFVIVAALIVLTLVFGRIYCSVICPLGVMQDIIGWLHRKTNKKHRYKFTTPPQVLRYVFLAIFVAALIVGVPAVVMLLAPYSSYGRMVTNMLQPLYIMANNGLAAIAEHYESYAFYSVDVWMRSLPALIVAVVSFVFVFVLMWFGGRAYCNNICPVGTVLGFLARLSILKIRFDKDKCINCGMCTKSCKAQCIDSQNQKIDYSRCVTCGTCIGSCKKKALVYAVAKKNANPATPHEEEGIDKNKRAFLIGGAIMTGTALLAQEKKKVDGGLAVIEDKIAPARKCDLVPPGAKGIANLRQHCTACQLCIAECPNRVLRPSGSLDNFMQPVMSYERGYCRPECTRCSELCPTGAIKPIEAPQKASTQIGHAVWLKQNCVVLSDSVECGNCARHCPSGAISMEPVESLQKKGSSTVPVVPIINVERCIGCGACEYVCPSRPHSAIYVEGHEQHREI